MKAVQTPAAARAGWKSIAALLALVLALHCATAFAQTTPAQPSQLILGERQTLQSKVLNEERSYWIFVPRSYERMPAKRYPVLYLLDGTAHFHAVTGIVHHLSANSAAVERIPEMIVVAIPNTVRTRDLTPTAMKEGLYSHQSGGADRFLQFLKTELFAQIESRYRTAPQRTLAGHSLGGLFTLHTFEQSPELFDNYIALDPNVTWDDELLVKRLEALNPASLKKPVTVYIALAGLPRQKEPALAAAESAIRDFSTEMTLKASPLLRFRFDTFEKEDHFSIPLIGAYQGLSFAFESYAK